MKKSNRNSRTKNRKRRKEIPASETNSEVE